MKNKQNSYLSLISVLFAFIIMGFADIVGVSTSYVKKDFALSDTLANVLPMIVFIWFALISSPTSVLMGKVGRKKTVLVSLIMTSVAMLLPLFSYSFGTVLVTFLLLGISNTILQVSLNPLLLNVISEDKVTSMLTLGQFIKAISSTLGPVIVSAAVGLFGNWHAVFVVYAVTSLISFFWLLSVHIEREEQTTEKQNIMSTLVLFTDKKLLSYFIVILLSVGFEIGLVTAVPKYFSSIFNLSLEFGAYGCSLYYLARMLGTLLGSFILSRYSPRKFFMWTMFVGVASLLAFMLVQHATTLLVILFIVGLFCANIFPITYSLAIQSNPAKTNEISAMMIMGVAGGAILPFIMGIIADCSSQWLSLFVPLAALVYILCSAIKFNKEAV